MIVEFYSPSLKLHVTDLSGSKTLDDVKKQYGADDFEPYVTPEIPAEKKDLSAEKAQLAVKGLDQTTIDNLKKVIFNG